MFKSVSEAYAILSNPDRRKKYDLWGDTGNDEDGTDDFMNMFGDMFSGGNGFSFGMDDDFESFINILEGDNVKSFNGMFRNLGKNHRTGVKKGGRAAKASGRAKGGKQEDDMMGDMMAMMMGEMMSMGLGGDEFGMSAPKGKSKKS